MRVLGIDPGPSKTAHALVRMDDLGWFGVSLANHASNDSHSLRIAMRFAADKGIPIAIEQITGEVYKKRRASNLFDTKRVEGIIETEARHLGAFVSFLSARAWRTELCRSPTASDAQVRIVIEGICKTLPAHDPEKRPHIYDAIGAAVVTIILATMGEGRRFKLPPKVEEALLLQQLNEKQLRAEKKARGEAPEQVRLALSAVQRKRKSEASKLAWQRRKAG